MNVVEIVMESNRIEGIARSPTKAEIDEHERFVALETVTLTDLITFVFIYQPDARLRDQDGLNVRVGSYYPPRGGPHIRERTTELLHRANHVPELAWDIHVAYETLHPFTDGNGRSGRALWYWCMRKNEKHTMASLGFLHAFYYQTLREVRP